MIAIIYTTYGIRDPRTGGFVYVGQTSNYEKRKRAHFRRKKRPAIKTQNIKTWLYDTLNAGVIPEFVVFETVESEEASLISEFKWVRKLRLEKHPLLNNWRIHREALLSSYSEEECLTIAISYIRIYLENKKVATRDYADATANYAKMTWLPSENKKLMELYAQGKGGREIAELLRRPFRGVCARLVRLGAVPNRASVRE